MDKSGVVRALVVISMILWLSAIGIFLILTPKYVDDFWYLEHMRSWFEGQGVFNPYDGGNPFQAGMPWKEIGETITEHVQTDNARLCNMSVIPFLLLPKWIGSGIALLAWAMAVFASIRLSGFRLTSITTSKNVFIVSVGIFLWTFCMSWSQLMGCLDYQFNYILTSGCLLGLIWYVVYHPVKTLGLITVFALSCIIGASQEGMACPVLAGTAVLMISNRVYRQPKYIVPFVGLGLGVLYLMLMPAAAERMGRDFLRGSVVFAMAGHPVFILFIMTLTIQCIRRKSIRIGDLLAFALISGLISIALQVLTTGERRVGWWADLMSVIGIMRILNNVHVIDKQVWYFLSALLVGVAIAHWALVDVYTIKVRNVFGKVLTEHVGKSRSTVFVDCPTFYDLPIICMGQPDVGMFVSPYTLLYLNRYYHGEDHDKYLRVIPKSLKFIEETDGTPVAGNSGIRRTGNVYYMPGDSGYGEERIYHVTLDNGIETDCKFILYPFRSEGDGRIYTYCYPWHGNWKMLTGNIVKIEN